MKNALKSVLIAVATVRPATAIIVVLTVANVMIALKMVTVSAKAVCFALTVQ